MIKNREAKDEKGYFGFMRSEMLKYIPENANRILEVGCGEGVFCNALKKTGREIWGIELDANSALKAEKIVDKVIIGSIDELISSLPKMYFDCIIFNDVFEHLYMPWETLNKIKVILSKNGVIVSSIPNFRYVNNLLLNILWNKDFKYNPEGGIMDDTHIRFFTSKSIIRMYEEQGYEILIHEGIKPCKGKFEKLSIALSFGLLSDTRYKQYATVAKIKSA
jgi:2-polyprenyl-3-methyl-5-hydroxy-6-metoxy-1,4-benzoquinol methylase